MFFKKILSKKTGFWSGCVLAISALSHGAAYAAEEKSPPQLPMYATPAELTTACDQALANGKVAIQTLQKMPNTSDFLAKWDDMVVDLEEALGPAYLFSAVHPDKAIRDAGEACTQKAAQFDADLYQNEALFALLKSVKGKDSIDTRLQRSIMVSFDDSGVTLPEDKRARAKAILVQMQALEQEFDRNLRDNPTRVVFSSREQIGLPDSYLQRVKRDARGNIALGFSYPEYVPFMANASDDKARKKYYMAFLTRGGQRNLALLDQIVQLRKELASLRNLPSFAHMVTRRNMVGKPEVVMEFLDEVKQVVAQAERSDLKMLKEEKARLTGWGIGEVQVYPWDKEYYMERLRQNRYAIDQEALRSYFKMPGSRDWLLSVTSQLYGVKFEKKETPVWDKLVEYYQVSDSKTGSYIGGLYLDLYPRAGKYGHAAAFGVRGGATRIGRTPITVLVCNFNPEGLTHDELETFTHEFGHAMHGIFSKTRYNVQAGTSVERDFVEAPSQMYEEWARRPETLALFPVVCPDCLVLSKEMVARLDQARRLGQGMFYGRQHLYATYDMALAIPEPGKAMETWQQLESITPLKHVIGSQFPGTFGHIAGGYAAGYYGYMWSEALALDFVSKFGKNLLDPEMGKRFREKVLSNGGQYPAGQMVRDFLGRETNPDAFFQEIKGKRKSEE